MIPQRYINKPGTTYDYEKTIFVAAVEELKVAEGNDTAKISGYDALVTVLKRRPDLAHRLSVAENPAVAKEWERYGPYVELAAELEPPIDQQG
jgi:hypothetical protein